MENTNQTIQCHGESMIIYKDPDVNLPERIGNVLKLPERYNYEKIKSPKSEIVFIGAGEGNDPMVMFGIDERPFLSYLQDEAKQMYKDLKKHGVKILKPEATNSSSMRQGDVFVTHYKDIGDALEKTGTILPMPDNNVRIAGTRHTIGGQDAKATIESGDSYVVSGETYLSAPDHKNKKIKKGIISVERAKFHDINPQIRGID